jgi:hypothetical protein
MTVATTPGTAPESDAPSANPGEVAVMYAAEGWAVFPLWWVTPDGRCACPGGDSPENSKSFCGRTTGGAVLGSPGKHPIPTVARHGVNDASRDPRVVERWWNRYPQANIGLPAGGNGLAIIDVDLDKPGTKENFDRLTTWSRGKGVDLLATLTQRTGAGGLHLLHTAAHGLHAASCRTETCNGCIRNGQSNKPPFGPDMAGIDTRGCGGYIVAAPSIHVSGRSYEWIDPYAEPVPWPVCLTRLMEYAARPPAPAPHRRNNGAGSASPDRYGQAALTRELDILRATKPGGRNGALNRSAFALGQLVAGGLLDEATVRAELYEAALAIGLGEAETYKSINSGLRAGLAKPRTRQPVSA